MIQLNAKWYIRAAIHDKSKKAVIAQTAYYKAGCLFEEIAKFSYDDYYEKQAVKYYAMAANYGLPIALCKLGEFYENHGEEKKAIEYYNRASDEAYFKYVVMSMNGYFFQIVYTLLCSIGIYF